MKRRRLSSILRGFALTIMVLIVLIYLVLPAAFGIAALVPTKSAEEIAPVGSEKIMLPTSDNLQLSGWYTPSTNGAVIILIHGAGGSKADMLPYTNFLSDHGYGTLAFDMRGHGESEGRINRFGWQGTVDLGATVDYLRTKAEAEAIGGLGISLGGEALLGAASSYPQIQAIAVDGATHRSTQELLALESERPLIRNFTARVMYASVQLFSGEKPPKPLLDSMVESKNIAYYFIAGGNEPMETAYNRLFLQSLGSRAELWVVPGAGHTAAFKQVPSEYEERLIDFFDSNLLDQ